MTSTPPDIETTLRSATATIRRLRARLAAAERDPGLRNAPLAVVGMACRLPGGVATPGGYWDLLLRAADAVSPVESKRWAGRAPAVGGGGYAGTIDDVAIFDAACFGIGEAEARMMDPQQRLMLTICWEAVERWGRNPAELHESDTGVFVGVGHQDYLTAMLAAGVTITGPVGAGNARSIVANRVSYVLGLRGPSLAVDTACSSSLVAIHLAAQSLRAGECSTAFAGGVNLILAPESTLVTGRALPLAPDGRTKTFDAEADGMVRGEGAGVVVLRRLEDALADGDHVHAVVLGTGTNQDGRTNGLTAPSPTAQELLLRRVLVESRLEARAVTYVETHGTGTPLGDPIEVEALQRVYGAGQDAPTCWLGSVKPNLGHLESAAGIASFIKAVLAVEQGGVPRQIGLTALNPEIHLDGSRFRVPSTTISWVGRPRYAAVSSFGFGGTNAHVILASHQAPSPPGVPDEDGPTVIPLSGRSREGLRVFAQAVSVVARQASSPLTVAAAAAHRRAHFAHRLAVVASPSDLGSAIAAAVADSGMPNRRAAVGRTAYVFGGQGVVWGTQILGDPIVLAEAQRWDDECAEAGYPAVSPVLNHVVMDPATLADTRRGQLALAVAETAMASRLTELGLRPDLVVGHSLGEIVAALIAGRITRADAARLIRARSYLQHARVAGGAMAVLRGNEHEVAAALQRHGDPSVGIAAHNAPEAVVVAGPRDAVIALLDTGHPPGRLLDTNYAFHSPALAALDRPVELADVTLLPGGGVEWVSTVTGSTVTRNASTDHWLRNLAAPVLFREAITTALEAGVVRFVEVAPRSCLATHILRCAEESATAAVAIRCDRPDLQLEHRLLTALAQAWEAGADVEWTALHPDGPVVPDLPTSPFERSEYWFTDTGSTRAATPPTSGRAVHRRVSTAGAGHPPDGKVADPALLTSWIQQMIAEVAGFETAASVDPTLPATELDVDSAEFVEVKNRLEDRLGVAVPITLLLNGSSIEDISAVLTATSGDLDTMGLASTHHNSMIRGQFDLGGRSVEDLPEEELDRLLALHHPVEEVSEP